MLAGVSVSWYTWLEQGRNIKVSDSVLDSISTALRLTDTERAHLYRLAGANPPQLPAKSTTGEVSRLQRIVEALPAPAYISDRVSNCLAANGEARSVLGIGGEGYNHLTEFFTDQSSKQRFVNWHDLARQLVGQFRVQAARFPAEPVFTHLASRLCAVSTTFAELWARHETQDCAMTHVAVRVPDHRQQVLRFEQLILGLADRNDLLLFLYAPSGQEGESGFHELRRNG